MTCAFVPPNPNELTPAARGPSECQSRSSAGMSSLSRLMRGLSRLQPRCGKITRSRSDSTTLISPATPAAASRCPMFVFTDPIQSRSSDGSASLIACTSTGSPSGVPVPCASRYPMRAPSMPASASAARITRRCASPFGAVRPLLRPSWLTAEPLITARTGSPSACASRSRLRITMPQPSPRT